LVGPQPLTQLPRYRFDHPVREQSRDRGVLDEANELTGQHHPGRASPSAERLCPHTSAIGKGDGGQVLQEELSLGQPGANVINVNHVAGSQDKLQRCHSFPSCPGFAESYCRTPQFSSGAGREDFTPRNAVMPAPSAATAGSPTSFRG